MSLICLQLLPSVTAKRGTRGHHGFRIYGHDVFPRLEGRKLRLFYSLHTDGRKLRLFYTLPHHKTPNLSIPKIVFPKSLLHLQWLPSSTTDISLQGIAAVTPNGLLQLTNATTRKTGHAFYTKPIRFKDSPNGNVSSFSTTFVFAINPRLQILSGLGMTFVVAPKPASRTPMPANTWVSSTPRTTVWIDYDGLSHKIDVTMAPFNEDKPRKPLVSTVKDLSSVLLQDMFVGFSSSTGLIISSDHFVLGWSFAVKGKAPPLALSKLPKIPSFPRVDSGLVNLLLVFLVRFIVRRRRKFAEEIEDWETEFAKIRLKFKDLYYATKGFKEKGLLGIRRVWERLQRCHAKTKKKIAVKRVSNESRQGLKEFVSEIVSIEVTLDWKQRFKVIKGVASGLFFLHEEWEQVVIHRDIKASNVLLDAELNGRLGDFGLARLCGHGSDPLTTRVAGTWGYLAPDHIRTGRPRPLPMFLRLGCSYLK
ncbi:unnamed protein product [Microthlaspi erraticum]|uniref:Protein kinase domain-containing protein n=1 Tax=Microthlaspi erraticum TaxID=1685480 RepID=A0A6D2J1L4_9BRAS|nr:unnamed protein product [Microthlaspi erraticum]